MKQNAERILLHQAQNSFSLHHQVALSAPSTHGAYNKQPEFHLFIMFNTSDLEIIKCNAIGDGLAPIRVALRSNFEDLGIAWSVEGVQQIEKRGDLHSSRETTLSNMHSPSQYCI